MTVSRSVISDEAVPPYDPLTAVEPMRLADEAEVYAAIVTGLRDYVRKNGFRSVVLGLSGGIDSAVTAASPSTRSVPARCTASRCPAATPAPIPVTTQLTSPDVPDCTTAPSPSRRWWRRS